MRDQPVTRIMTVPAVSVAPTDTLEHARRLMAGSSLHHLVVLEDGRLVGVLSATDLVGSPATVVAGLMHPDPVSIPATASLHDAADVLASGAFHSLPVVDPDGRVVGMVTATDLIRLLIRQLPAPAHRAAESREGLTLVTDAEREHLLHRVLAAADLYLHSGQGTHEHAVLLRAVEKAKEGVRPGLQINRL
ncbi:MAG: CBS domain-containing protein [Gammaproteobacteria bacterium]|nr:CBS domain-containing protein [Gammaproteobacteria bacterium]